MTSNKPVILSFDRSHLDAIDRLLRDMQIAAEHLTEALEAGALGTITPEDDGYTFEEWNAAHEELDYFHRRIHDHIQELNTCVSDAWKEAQGRIAAERPKAEPSPGANGSDLHVKVAGYPLTCAFCRREFRSSWPNQRYCSGSCKSRFRTERRVAQAASE